MPGVGSMARQDFSLSYLLPCRCFLSHLMGRSHSIHLWISLREGWSMGSYIFSRSLGRRKIRNLLSLLAHALNKAMQNFPSHLTFSLVLLSLILDWAMRLANEMLTNVIQAELSNWFRQLSCDNWNHFAYSVTCK